MQVSQQQAEAINCIHESSCIVALPGAGKTRTLIAKAKAMLDAKLDGIIMVSYTVDSAGEIRERLTNELNKAPTDRQVRVSTFHALLLDHLRVHIPQLQLVDPQKETSIWYSVYSRTGLEANEFSRFCNFMQGKGSFKEETIEQYEAIKALVDTEISEMPYAVTLNSVTKTAVKWMLEGKCPLIKCKFIFADEFQDADEDQLKFLVLHANQGAVVTVVGDDDQSIYGFRNSLGVKAFINFRKMTNAKLFILDVNYRSHSEILDRSFELIEHNEQRIDKEPKSFRGQGGSVRVHEFETAEFEAEQVALMIKETPSINTFIIARNNVYLERIEQYLTDLDIPYTRNGGTNYFDASICQLAISSLSAFASNDIGGVSRVLSVLYPHNTDVINYKSLRNKQLLPASVSATDKQSFNHLRFAMHCLKSGQTNKSIDHFFRGLHDPLLHLGYAQTDLLSSLSRHLNKLSGNSIKERLMALQSAKSEEGANVKLMTMHGSKGLESPRVFIVGFARRIIPSTKLREGEDLDAQREEERRLAFVAMTRAEDELHICYPRGTDNQAERFGPSTFLIQSGLLI